MRGILDMVKTKMKIIFIGVICLLLLVIVFILYERAAKKPYAKISREDITEVSIIYGELEPYKLTNQETDRFLELLREIIIYQRDDTYVEYNGVGCEGYFCVKMKNGKELNITPGNPFFIINKKGYRTEYKPCDKLSQFHYEIREKIYHIF